MVDDDGHAGISVGQLGEVGQARVVEGKVVERQVKPGQHIETPHESGVVEIKRAPDAAEKAPPRFQVSDQDLLDRRAQFHVGMADDGANARLARRLRALFGDGGDECTLSDGLQVLRSILTIAGSGIDEDRLFHVVAGARVLPEVLQVISPPRRRNPPEMMMGIDDRQFGVEHRFGSLPSEPTHLFVVVGMRHGGILLSFALEPAA